MKSNIVFDDLKQLFLYETTVRVGDLNYGNHLAHDRLITILHDARVSFLNKNHMSEIKIVDNIALILVNLNINYTKEAFLGDKLIIRLFNGEIRNTSFDITYKVENIQKQDIATCSTKMVCVHMMTRKIYKIPDNLLKALN